MTPIILINSLILLIFKVLFIFQEKVDRTLVLIICFIASTLIIPEKHCFMSRVGSSSATLELILFVQVEIFSSYVFDFSSSMIQQI